MLKWFINESKKEEEEPPSTVKFFNNTFITFMTAGTWLVYLLALFLIGISVYFFHLDQQRRKALLQRRREIRRANEKPPQKRRPGAATRNHEIFRNIMGKVHQYIQPNDYVQYVLLYGENGDIYGTLANKDKWANRVEAIKEDKLPEPVCDEILPEDPPET